MFQRKTRFQPVLHGNFAFPGGLGFVEFLQQSTRAIGGAVVDDQNLFVQRSRLNAQQHFLDEGMFIVDRDDDGNLHGDKGSPLVDETARFTKAECRCLRLDIRHRM